MGAIRGRLGQYGNAMNDFFQKYNMDYTDLSKILNLQNDQLGNIATNMNQIPGMINQQMQPDPQISSLIGNLGRGGNLPNLRGINPGVIGNIRDARGGYRR